MPFQCPTCSRTNPANAAYCFYDGRALSGNGQHQEPVGLGTRPFPFPFSFSDGHGCANYNQLVLACDRRWIEARTNLLNGTWETFFSTIGRTDLALLAKHASKDTDPDIGLCRLLEGLPADPEALRPAKLAMTSLVENLEALEPGKDRKFQIVIENQGLLFLQGTVTTDCDWLFFNDRQENVSSKLFQTRDAYTLPVWIGKHKLRAMKQPLIGSIVIDTNGGKQTVVVRATVPVKPFPAGQVPNNVLMGATSPREIANKAREHAKEAASLFEQGMVKAWYESNGWSYPIQGTQARGKGALQQFFEALGLTKAPKLEINTERITCKGEVGERLGRDVVILTKETKPVHAEGHGSVPWIKVLPAKPQGNSVTLPVRIEVPERPGETVNASVTFQGNGQQRFVVPVTVTVLGLTPQQEEEKAARRRKLEYSIAGAGLGLLLLIGLGVFLFRGKGDSGTEIPPIVEKDKGVGPDKDKPEPKSKAWWSGIPGHTLGASLAKLKQAAGAHHAIFDSIADESNDKRRNGYEQLATKLPELARNPAVKGALGPFVAECCVFEPSEFNLNPLLRGLAGQFPAEDREFAAEDKGEGVERASFWLGVYFDAIHHKAVSPDRNRSLVSELSKILGFDTFAPAAELRDRAEKSLAELCYHNTLPTAEKSVDQALAIREVLLTRFSRHYTPEFRDQDDAKLLAIGLPKGNDLWPKLKPLFESCAKSNEVSVGFKLVDLYAKADGELTAKMEEVLKERWKVAGNAKIGHADKAAAIRNSMASQAKAAKISHAERVRRLLALVGNSPVYPPKAGGQQELASLQETVRLAHASTMASLLFNKDAEAGRFDDLVARIPVIEQGKPMDEEKNPDVKPRPPGGAEFIDVGNGSKAVQWDFTERSDLDTRRGAYRKEYLVRMRGGEIYYLYMRSTAMTPSLRLEAANGQQLSNARGANAQIVYSPPSDGDFKLIASSIEKKAVGRFTVQVSQQQQVFQFGGRRNPFGQPFPGMPRGQDHGPGPDPDGGEKKSSPVNQSDLTDLANRQSEVRINAFKNLASNASNDLPYRYAIRLANYLLVTDWPDGELNGVTESLNTLTRCRQLLQALSDVIAKGDRLAQARTTAVVGASVGKPMLRFDRDEDWRGECRKLLLKRALELTGRAATATNDADRAADFLRDLYKEQGMAFGLDAPDFEEQSQLAPVLERLIKHVAAKAAEQKLTPSDKASLEQVDRELRAAKFAAGNDLEHVVLLQRLWVKVLTLAIQGQAAEPNRKTLADIPQELDKKDRVSSSLLDQLRSGEEMALRVWALARDLKPK